MAGSYNHIIDDTGNFADNDRFSNMIENLGDSYEMAEEMYGMIWYLADANSTRNPGTLVAEAQAHYRYGLEIAKRENATR